MGDDFFVSRPPGALMASPIGATSHAAPPRAAATSGAGFIAALAAAVSGALVALGAYGSWLTISAGGVSVSFSGRDAHLHGPDVLILGIVGLAFGVALAATPRGTPLARALVAATVVVGLVSLGLTVHAYAHLSDVSSDLSGIASMFGGRVGPGWGLWVDGIGSTGLVVGSLLSVVL